MKNLALSPGFKLIPSHILSAKSHLDLLPLIFENAINWMGPYLICFATANRLLPPRAVLVLSELRCRPLVRQLRATSRAAAIFASCAPDPPKRSYAPRTPPALNLLLTGGVSSSLTSPASRQLLQLPLSLLRFAESPSAAGAAAQPQLHFRAPDSRRYYSISGVCPTMASGNGGSGAGISVFGCSAAISDPPALRCIDDVFECKLIRCACY